VLFLSLAGALSGVLYSLERFTVPAIVSIVWNLTIIAAILLLQGALGVYAVAIGMLIGTLLQLALLAGAMGHAERWIWPGFGLRDPLLRRVLLLMVPITITLGILNFNALIGTWFAQFVSDRAAAEIGYAFRLYQLPQGIFAVTIGTVLFPSLSRFAAQRESELFRTTVSFGVRQMIFVSLPFVAWFLVIPEPFVRLVYERGHFGPEATAEVAPALAFLCVGLAFANSNIMFNRAFQSMQKPWLPLFVSIGNLFVNVLLCWLLYKPLGVAGITLSMGAVSAVNFGALFLLLRRHVGGIDGRRIAGAAGAALLCAGALAAVSWSVWRLLAGFADGGFWPLLAAVLAAVVAGAAAYIGLAKALRLEELTAVWRILRRRSPAPGSDQQA
jgi:putative peptidoglycan lipid II flippase